MDRLGLENIIFTTTIKKDVIEEARNKNIKFTARELELTGILLGAQGVIIDMSRAKDFFGEKFESFFKIYANRMPHVALESLSEISFKNGLIPIYRMKPNKYFSEYEPKIPLKINFHAYLKTVFPSLNTVRNSIRANRKPVSIYDCFTINGKNEFYEFYSEENSQLNIAMKDIENIHYHYIIKHFSGKKIHAKSLEVFQKKNLTIQTSKNNTILVIQSEASEYKYQNLKGLKKVAKTRRMYVYPYIEKGSKIQLSIPDTSKDNYDKITNRILAQQKLEGLSSKLIEKIHTAYLAITDWEKEITVSHQRRQMHNKNYRMISITHPNIIKAEKKRIKLVYHNKPILSELKTMNFLEIYWPLQALRNVYLCIKNNFPFKIEFNLDFSVKRKI